MNPNDTMPIRRSALTRARTWLAAGVTFGALVLMTAPAMAEVVHLRTGRAIKGKILESESDENRLVMNDAQSGARVVFRWDAIDPADRQRLQEEMGLINKARQLVDGHRVELKLNDGTTEEIYGLVKEEGPPELVLLQEGKEVRIPSSRVAGITETQVTPLEVYSAEQLWEQFLEKLGKELQARGMDPSQMDGTAHFRAGEYAEYLEMYEKAREHYTAAANDETFVRARVAAQRLEVVEALIRDSAARKKLREANQKIGLRAFDRAREILEGFQEEHTDVSEATKNRFTQTEKKFNKARDKYFTDMARREFVKLTKKLIETKLRDEKELSITEGVAYTRRELIEEAYNALAGRMQRRDSTVTGEQARAFWDARAKRQWSRASFGAGTFIVKPPEIKPPSNRRRNNNARRRGGNSGGGAVAPVPKPPTRDSYWADAKMKEKMDWLFAYFVQNSGLFDVAEKPELRNCSTCQGIGLQSRQNSNGSTTYYLCTRCGGSQQDLTLKYR